MSSRPAVRRLNLLFDRTSFVIFARLVRVLVLAGESGLARLVVGLARLARLMRLVELNRWAWLSTDKGLVNSDIRTNTSSISEAADFLEPGGLNLSSLSKGL